MRHAKWVLAVSLLFTIGLNGEVYWRTPRDRASLTELLPDLGRVLYRDRAEINGITTELEVSAVNMKPDEILSRFAQWKSPHQLRVIGDTIRFQRPLPGDRMERLLLIFSGLRPVTAFRMITPAKLPTPVWPLELPQLPAGARITQVVKLGRSGAVWGEFHAACDQMSNIKSQAEAELRQRGYVPADRDGRGETQVGGIYVKTRPRRSIAVISVSDQGRGFFYTSTSSR